MITFNSPRANLYKSSEGFSVEVLGQTGLCYTEFNKSMFIDSELLLPPAAVLIYQDTISRWDSPNENLVVSSEDRSRILANIRAVFFYQGFEIQVV